MTIQEATRILKNHQSWRLGHHVNPNYLHQDLTPAIDTILEHLEKL